jgi:NADH:ubiquinone oxidoreductase subunit 5 (subunit L)/multisubunit Na+/H+ antiporter MnhA subunit
LDLACNLLLFNCSVVTLLLAILFRFFFCSVNKYNRCSKVGFDCKFDFKKYILVYKEPSIATSYSFIGFFLFVGAVGKSAQVGLHT